MDMDISMDIHAKSADMDMDMDGKFHIHGNPDFYLRFFVPIKTFKNKIVLLLLLLLVLLLKCKKSFLHLFYIYAPEYCVFKLNTCRKAGRERQHYTLQQAHAALYRYSSIKKIIQHYPQNIHRLSSKLLMESSEIYIGL